jgi:hypothetical protein
MPVHFTLDLSGEKKNIEGYFNGFITRYKLSYNWIYMDKTIGYFEIPNRNPLSPRKISWHILLRY